MAASKVDAMIWNSLNVNLVEKPSLPEGSPVFADWWETRRDQVHTDALKNPRFFNGPSVAIIGVEPDETGEQVTVTWTLSDYVNLLTVLETSEENLPAGLNRPFWSLCSGMSIITPLACADGPIWARRSQEVNTGRGRWLCTVAEGTEVEDIRGRCWSTTARRSIKEELGFENLTTNGAFLHVGVRKEAGFPKNLTHTRWWLPSYSPLSFCDVEKSWLDAEDNWENDALHLGESPPSTFNYPVPDLAAAALRSGREQHVRRSVSAPHQTSGLQAA